MTQIDLSGRAAITGGSPTLSAYLARPTGSGPWPAVVLVHEAFGLDDVMRRQADRLAAAGYLTIAPNLFSEGGARRCLVSTLKSLGTGTGRAFCDIEAARAEVLADPECTGKIGIIGFCMGGAFALLMSPRGFDVSAPNYGALPKDLDASLAGACPVVASYGGRDRAMKGKAAQLDAALTRLGVEHDVKEYPAAGHSFLNDAPVGPTLLRPLLKVANVGPEPASAADAWRRIEAYFEANLR